MSGDAGPLNLMRMIPDGITLKKFLLDHAFVTIIRGPWGSGKSAACCAKLFQAAAYQAPDRRGLRWTRWIVVRNTYPDLQETTVRTWLDWFPEAVYGPMKRSRPMSHMIKLPGPPHFGKPTTIEMEVVFLALDDDEDRKKLLSMEFTGAWGNEARELEKGIIDDIIGRTGRYPSMRDGGATWSGVILDTNAPTETHWLPIMMGEVPVPEWMDEEQRESLKKPEDWHYYAQPAALREVKDEQGRVTGYEPNPVAENVANLKGGFDWYLQRLGGKTRSWINVNFLNRLGVLQAGKSVWPTFSKEKHVAAKPIPFDPSLPLYVGVDQTGRRPAAVYGQVRNGHWFILAERIGVDVNNEQFAPVVKRKAAELAASAGKHVEAVAAMFYRDPHSERSDQDDQTADRIYLKHGVRLIPAPGGNTIKTRLDTVEVLFDNGKITISPTCPMLIAACDGGYHYRRLKITGAEIYAEVPEKDGHSNPADALQYLLLGAGEGRNLIGAAKAPAPVKTAVGYRPRQNRSDLWSGRRNMSLRRQ
jgi:hypothetical protein